MGCAGAGRQPHFARPTIRPQVRVADVAFSQRFAESPRRFDSLACKNRPFTRRDGRRHADIHCGMSRVQAHPEQESNGCSLWPNAICMP